MDSSRPRNDPPIPQPHDFSALRVEALDSRPSVSQISDSQPPAENASENDPPDPSHSEIDADVSISDAESSETDLDDLEKWRNGYTYWYLEKVSYENKLVAMKAAVKAYRIHEIVTHMGGHARTLLETCGVPGNASKRRAEDENETPEATKKRRHSEGRLRGRPKVKSLKPSHFHAKGSVSLLTSNAERQAYEKGKKRGTRLDTTHDASSSDSDKGLPGFVGVHPPMETHSDPLPVLAILKKETGSDIDPAMFTEAETASFRNTYDIIHKAAGLDQGAVYINKTMQKRRKKLGQAQDQKLEEDRVDQLGTVFEAVYKDWQRKQQK